MSAPLSSSPNLSASSNTRVCTALRSPTRPAAAEDHNGVEILNGDKVSAGIREIQAGWDRRERAARRDRAIFKTALLSAIMRIA